MKVWVLLLENVEGENSVELYSTQEKAHAAFENYIAENKGMSCFKEYDDCISWFDFERSDRYSYISMYEQGVF